MSHHTNFYISQIMNVMNISEVCFGYNFSLIKFCASIKLVRLNNVCPCRQTFYRHKIFYSEHPYRYCFSAALQNRPLEKFKQLRTGLN